MGEAVDNPGILLVDDGELDRVARTLARQGHVFERLQGRTIPRQIPPPRDLLIATPRRIGRVRRGSPANAPPERPLRVIATEEDSPAMRRQLRRAGLDLLVRLPADDEIWRLVVARALYRGSERRQEARVPVASPVEIDARVGSAGSAAATDSAAGPEAIPPAATLLDVSNRGCRLRTAQAFSIGDAIAFTIAAEALDGIEQDQPLPLRGRIRRMTQATGSEERFIAVVFDADLPESTRIRLTAMINRWASGPGSSGATSRLEGPSLPPCRLPSLPDLMLDDETDPPIRADSTTRVAFASPDPTTASPGSAKAHDAPARPTEGERRRQPRGRFESSFLAETPTGPLVMIGRELSPGGLRVERIEELRLGDRFRLALHGPGPTEPFVVEAEVARDDGPQGYALLFRHLDPETTRALGKLVACLPASAGSRDEPDPEDGLGGGWGAILTEILSA